MCARILIALGGNAILKKGQRGEFDEQMRNVRGVCKQIVEIIKMGHEVVITHGNGPQVGNILLQNEIARDQIPQMPLDVCVAESQGMLGYMISQALQNELWRAGIKKPVVSVITRVLVDKNDPEFENPSKPIGRFYSKEEAEELMKLRGWKMKEDSGRGWRRVVPSPRPIAILEGVTVKHLVDMGAIVIAAGGGGIPVVRDVNGELEGVEAVVDKDLASAKLAEVIKADIMLILTDVEKVALNFGKPNQRFLDLMTVEDAIRYYEEGHFPPGSMGPKILAAIEFLRNGGKKVIISSIEKGVEALEGKTGTHIIPEASVSRTIALIGE